jgi:hypothetical protein
MIKPGHQILFVLTIVCLNVLHSRVFSAEGDKSVYYNLSIHAGSVLPHHASIVYLNREYLKSIELNAWFGHPEGEETRNPLLGPGYFYSNLGNKDVYGNFHAAYFGMLNQRISKRIPLQLKTGAGIAYATKKFDLESNYLNRAIGSHFNAYGQISLSGKIPIAGDKLIFRPGISFHHISNGRVVTPNQGINMLTLNAGLYFKSAHTHSGSVVLERDTITKGKGRFSVIFAPGIKDIDRRIDKQIFTSSLIFDYGYIYRPERSLGIGISFFYNKTGAYLPVTRTEKGDSFFPFQSALHISLQRDKGPLAFILHPGIYIYNQANEGPYLTNRLGIKYLFKNNLALQFSIKSHWIAIADYFEWGIGYEFNR